MCNLFLLILTTLHNRTLSITYTLQKVKFFTLGVEAFSCQNQDLQDYRIFRIEDVRLAPAGRHLCRNAYLPLPLAPVGAAFVNVLRPNTMKNLN